MYKVVKVFFLIYFSVAHNWLSRSAAEESIESDKWTALFNGRNFDGFYTYLEDVGKNIDPKNVFHIEDEVIHLYKNDRHGDKVAKGYFATNAEYANYHIRFQYKWGKKKFAPRFEMPRDAGCMYHVVEPEKVWPRCLEYQVQENDVGDCITVHGVQITTTIDPKTKSIYDVVYKSPANGGKDYTIGRRSNTRFVKESTHEVEGWNTAEVIVRGSEEVVHIINGQEVFRARNLKQLESDKKTWVPIGAGRILFQAECAEVFYKNIEIKPIKGLPLHPASAAIASAHSSLKSITVPSGFEIVSAVVPGLVEYPTLACQDGLGNLYVSEGANINDPYPVLAKTLPRSIRKLRDTDGDGVYDKMTVFADKMTFPYGGVFHNGALYVASDPSIWRLEDTDGDGVADKREEFLGRFSSEGHAACMKGGYIGPDGMMYFAGGNESGGYDLRGADGIQLTDKRIAPCVFRIRPDGKKLEYFANGAAGLYDLCFNQTGDVFGVVTILRYPRGDGLMHWAYGGVYESSRGSSRFAQPTGDKMTAVVEWAQTSPSGSVLFESDSFGKSHQGSIFTAHFGTHVVTRNEIARQGGGWKSVNEENFIQSTDTNCRFTDLIEDADGSMLVVNTGGWFRIGCPTSEVGNTPLTGDIYRVRKIGYKPPADPRGLKIDWGKQEEHELVRLLDDDRTLVRQHALAEIARRGNKCIHALQVALSGASVRMCNNAIWGLTRIDSPHARAAVRTALMDADSPVLLSAIHSAGLWRDQLASNQLVKLLDSNDKPTICKASEALGRLGNQSSVPALLKVLEKADDRSTHHAIIFALIEIKAYDETLAGLKAKNNKTVRGALIALDQMSGSKLTEDQVTQFLFSDDQSLQRTAINVYIHHNHWTNGVVKLCEKWMSEPALKEFQANALTEILSARMYGPAAHKLMTDALVSSETPAGTKLLLLNVISKGRSRDRRGESWSRALAHCIKDADTNVAAQAIVASSSTAPGKLNSELSELAMNESKGLPLRIAAATEVVRRTQHKQLDDKILAILFENCSAEAIDPVTRLSIAKTLGEAPLSLSQLTRMLAVVEKAGPVEFPSLIRAYEDSKELVDGEKLFLAVSRAPGIGSISASRLQKLFKSYPDVSQRSISELVESLGASGENISSRLKELEYGLTGGDPELGRQVFYGKSACSQCHRVNGVGSGIGPDLSQIGKIRSRKDLLESIAFPSATLARGFEPVTIEKKSGKSVNGILRRETPTDIFLLTADRNEVTIARDDIDEITPSQTSIMPQGLERNLLPNELKDLLAFLESLKGTN